MMPEWIGLTSGSQLPLGPRSGRAAVKARLQKMGLQPTDEQMIQLFEGFKRLADEKKRIEDEDLQDLFDALAKSPV
jgi:2-isopropylmalate synthase